MSGEVIEGQVIDAERRLQEARGKSKNYVFGALGIGLVPVPLIDMAGITLLQLKMLHSLSKLYGVKFSSDIGKSMISSLVGGVLPTPAGLTLASLTKSVPVLGSVLGATSVSLIAGASTYALSRVFIQHFESGGTFLDFKPEKVRAFFAEEFEKGKLYAENLKKKEANTNTKADKAA